jgi:prepilin-type N-terminal cleavage/methylation domain-containing protein
MTRSVQNRQGFTLIEMSIVLVIIGFIIGGILVGQDMISAAGARATISQVERYNTAANTFVTKFGYLPGDIPDPAASSFGFQARGQYAGEGDGNGVIEGISANAPSSNNGYDNAAGETVVFWTDLSAAKMIDGQFNAASTTVIAGAGVTGTGLATYFPSAKVGNGNYFYIWSRSSINYFGLYPILQITNTGSITGNVGLTVAQAFAIDTKIDDGLPTAGRVTAEYAYGGVASWPPSYASADTGSFTSGSGIPATAPSPSTCFDNGNVHWTTMQYSMTQNGGAGLNCVLSFRMQGAAR